MANEREIVERLRRANEYEPLGHDAWEAADAIERLLARAEAAEALVKEAGEVLFKLHHAACGKTGFAAAVRLDSMKAYPWPALDIADEAAAAFLAKMEKTDER